MLVISVKRVQRVKTTEKFPRFFARIHKSKNFRDDDDDDEHMPSSRALFESGVLLCFLLAFISLVSEGLLFSSISSSDNVDSAAAQGRSFAALYRKTFDLMRKTNYNVVSPRS